MGIVDAISRRDLLLQTGGDVALHIAYPEEFELYVFALEVVDANFTTEKYFVFPVNPSGITETKNEITNVKKTTGGITVLTTPTFVPIDININGNFGGKQFKVLLGNTYQNLISDFSNHGSINSISQAKASLSKIFDENIKTGYGCIKILKETLETLKKTDVNSPRQLIFYNLALGTTYFVKPINFSINQTQESNMIWNYSLTLRAVGKVDSYIEKDKVKSNQQLVVDSYIQSSVNNLVNSILSL